ncbi:LacI family transcriptional regulator [Deinococcus sp. KSM4-11]|uniref:LacI family DNA-binding transcriptional regulator n=1 Tax=Deinococcus sp. KSM4-11 TaxID=2568654 RepID=UPI0010A4C5D8|nr:LacI family DNA-binding transcriptional regulator [Deinococcus sp. KSM4-11]THF86128.1 LacI family transcriptional regulator [Deinococcus sp. KSM4-11]
MPPPQDASRTAGIREVARQAGVSIATVSRVFNAGSTVQQETRERVLERAQALGYHPSPLGRHLVLGRSDLLGVILPNSGFPLYGAVLQGIEDTIRDVGMSVLLVSGLDDPQVERQAARQLLQHAVDGSIVVNSRAGTMLPRHRNRAWVHVAPEDPAVPHRVELDNRQGGLLAALELLAGGTRHPAFVGAPGREAAEREQGFMEIMTRAGLMVHRAPGDYTEDSGLRVGMSLPTEVDAVFVAGDLMAAGVLRALHQAGRRVPSEVTVVGFDDSLIAPLLYPRLSSVRQPAYDLGVAAARLALNLIAGEAGPDVLLEPKLVRRESSARVPPPKPP